MTNELSTERAIEALYTVRAYYASLTAGYPKGKDCRGIGDVMCNEIANSCLMAINTLEQQPCEDCISREYIEPIVEELENICINGDEHILSLLSNIKNAPSVTPERPKGKWIKCKSRFEVTYFKCSECGRKLNWIDRDDNYCNNCGAEMGGADETN